MKYQDQYLSCINSFQNVSNVWKSLSTESLDERVHKLVLDGENVRDHFGPIHYISVAVIEAFEQRYGFTLTSDVYVWALQQLTSRIYKAMGCVPFCWWFFSLNWTEGCESCLADFCEELLLMRHQKSVPPDQGKADKE